jgi:hypothetical protein
MITVPVTEMTMSSIRIDLVPSPGRPGKFDAVVRGTGEVLARRRRDPFVSAARELVRRGLPLDTTLEAPGRILPMPIGEAARWVYREGEKTRLHRERLSLEEALAEHPRARERG